MYSGMFFIEPLVIIPLSFRHIWRKYKVTKCDLFYVGNVATLCNAFMQPLQPFYVTFCLWLRCL